MSSPWPNPSRGRRSGSWCRAARARKRTTVEIPNPNRAAPWRPPRGDGRGDACWDLGCGIWDFRAMALIDELKRILEREKLYVQDKFEEWVTLAKTTH